MSFVPVQPNLFGNQSPQTHPQGGWNQQPTEEQYDYNPQQTQYSNQGYGYAPEQQYHPQEGFGQHPQYMGNAGYDGQYSAPSYSPSGGQYHPSSPPSAPMGASGPQHGYAPYNGYQAPGAAAPMSAEAPFGQFGAQLGQFGVLANPLAQMGLAQATQFVSTMNDSFVTRWTGSLRYYFSVNNSYVLHKLKILLFPFIHKSWSRRIVPAADGREMYLPPSQDVNAPDLYIPTMAFITYILLIALILGTSTTGFKPDVLGMTASSGLVTLALEVFLIKLGFYLLSYPPVLILDLVALCGYKFVGIIPIITAGWLFGWTGFFVSFLVLALFMAIFMVKTLRLVVPQPLEAMPKNMRNYALISIAIMQGIFTGILCWMDSRNQTTAVPKAM